MYQPRPSDFDFPCSDSFRGYTFDYCLLPDPGRYETYNEQDIPAPVRPPIYIIRHVGPGLKPLIRKKGYQDITS